MCSGDNHRRGGGGARGRPERADAEEEEGGGEGERKCSSTTEEDRKKSGAQTCDVLQKIRTEVFGHFRPLGALAGPRDGQKTTQDEKPVPGKGSGLPGTAY